MPRPLILDLDFTLLHLEAVADAIEVPGRTRSAYLAPTTVAALDEMQSKFDIVLATARSWEGTAPVAEGLEARGVRVAGLVLEDGARLGSPHELHPFEPQRDWKRVRESIDSTFVHEEVPHFDWQFDFEACLVARCNDADGSKQLMERFERSLTEFDSDLRTFRDGRKVYLTGAGVTKWTALERLLDERLPQAAGIGDGANDCCWLANIASPATLAGSSPLVEECVRMAGGFFSPYPGHTGISDALRHLANTHN